MLVVTLNYILLCVYMITSYIFSCELHLFWIQFWQKDKVLLHRVNKNNVKDPVFIVMSLLTLGLILICKDSHLASMIAVLVFHIIRPFICLPNKNDVLEGCKLNIGYGAALWYYKNYLTAFLPDNFLERVQTFESCNKVPVEKKLFILVPESCIVQRYLDNDQSNCIERCRELPECEKTNSGFKGRVYNITVYLLRANSLKRRMAIEYAQPLKGLFALKERKILTKEEMYYQRKLFVESLKEFLRDEHDLYKFCEIIEYNDNERKISDVLIDPIQSVNSIHEIVLMS